MRNALALPIPVEAPVIKTDFTWPAYSSTVPYY